MNEPRRILAIGAGAVLLSVSVIAIAYQFQNVAGMIFGSLLLVCSFGRFIWIALRDLPKN